MSIEKRKERKKQKFRKKYKVGLCLSGGGARGFSYVGAFKAFEECGIEFDAVAGTSIGSLFAAFYASGMKYEDIVRKTKYIKQSDFRKSVLGFLPSKMDTMNDNVRKVLPITKAEDLPIPYYAVAVDLKTGKEIRFSTGDLPTIITASCSIPGVFCPVRYRNMNLVDGGVKNNIPADVLKENGCDFVVTIDCNSTRGGSTESNNIITQFMTSVRIMMVNNSQKGLDLSDIVIRPNMQSFSSLSLTRKEEMIEEGYRATMEVMPFIEDLFLGKVKKK